MGVESVVHYHHVFSIFFEFRGLRWGNFRVMVVVRGFGRLMVIDIVRVRVSLLGLGKGYVYGYLNEDVWWKRRTVVRGGAVARYDEMRGGVNQHTF